MMSALVRKYPALSLLILAMILAAAPIVAASVGLVPPAFSGLAALSAGLAGIILAAIEGGKGGVRELLARILIWRVGIQWWAIALLLTIIPSVAGVFLFRLLGGAAVDWSKLQPLYTLIPTIIILSALAAAGEEFGWRGFALPRLQVRHGALVSGLIVGVIWAIWHTPLFFTPGTLHYQWRLDYGLPAPFLVYSLFVIAWSVQYTWLFNNTKGSVLLAAVFHGAGNAWMGNYINVYPSSFWGVMSFMIVTLILSVIIVLGAGAAHLSRTNQRNVAQSQGALTAAPF